MKPFVAFFADKTFRAIQFMTLRPYSRRTRAKGDQILPCKAYQ